MRLYNILSNYTIIKHHYDKPENRAKINEDELNKSIKQIKVFLNNNKDYDIITNKYKIFNKEKKERKILLPDKQKKYEQTLKKINKKIQKETHFLIKSVMKFITKKIK